MVLMTLNTKLKCLYLPPVPFQVVQAKRSHLAEPQHSTYSLWSQCDQHELHQCLISMKEYSCQFYYYTINIKSEVTNYTLIILP